MILEKLAQEGHPFLGEFYILIKKFSVEYNWHFDRELKVVRYDTIALKQVLMRCRWKLRGTQGTTQVLNSLFDQSIIRETAG